MRSSNTLAPLTELGFHILLVDVNSEEARRSEARRTKRWGPKSRGGEWGSWKGEQLASSPPAMGSGGGGVSSVGSAAKPWLKSIFCFKSHRRHLFWVYNGNNLRGKKRVFVRSAITPPKVNRNNLEHSEYTVGYGLTDFGRDRHSTNSLRGGWIFFRSSKYARFRRFPVRNISQNLDRTTAIGEVVKTFGTEFWKF